MNQTYNPALDGIRAVAILAVLAFHCRMPGIDGGFFGVDLFFVLSGYLITALLADEWRTEGAIHLSRFYWNRFLRLTPPLYAMLAVVALLGISSPYEVSVAALYLGDLIVPFSEDFGATSHSWSLAVEEHFYLAWPLLLVPVLRSRNPAVLVLVLFLAATIWRVVTLPLGPAEQVYFRFDARLTGLLLGAGLALVNLGSLERELRNRIGLVSAVILAVAATCFQIHTSLSLVFVQPLVELASAGLLVAALGRDTAVHRILAWDRCPGSAFGPMRSTFGTIRSPAR